MELVIGGRAQGKLAYVLAEKGLTEEAVSKGVFSDKPVLYGLQEIIFSLMKDGKDAAAEVERFVISHPQCIVICDEVGCGLVPMDPFLREYRDMVGHITCALAAKAQRVVRVYCGIGTVIKEG